MRAATMTVIEIGGAAFTFCAAHTGLHDGEFEPLHGHTFTPTLRITGRLDDHGMVADLCRVKTALSVAIAPLRRRTLMPADPLAGRCHTEDGQIVISCGGKRYGLPASDVVLLPVVNTTTEAIAEFLLDQILAKLPGEPRIASVELRLSEAPDTAVTITATPDGGTP